MRIEDLFEGNMKSAFYRASQPIDLPKLETLAKDKGFKLFVFEGEKIGNKSEFLDEFEKIMQPLVSENYSRNWDSFEETLTVTDWTQAKGIVLIYNDPQKFKVNNRQDFDMALNIFKYVVSLRQKFPNHPKVLLLLIFLRGEGVSDLEIDEL